jgi:transketolase
MVLNAISANLDSLVGGSADLGPSNKTLLDGEGHMSAEEPGGRNIHFGVREHAMGAIANGMALHGGVIPYTGTFLIFSDYMRPAIRLAALMGQRVVFVFTHDSIGLGEDGPTHQPIEQLVGLRAIPNLVVIRPADAHEVVESWRAALERRDGPTALVFSRHNVPPLGRADLASAEGLKRGGYVLWESDSRPEVVLMGTGSEMYMALEAGRQLATRGVCVRVVSMPSWELFEAQPREYRESVLPPDVKARVSIEAGATLGWERFVGLDGAAIGMTGFGASAPAKELFKQFGFTSDHVMKEALRLVGER